jgi:alpha-glucosidase
MYVIFESPLQMLADSPSNYKRNQECTSFIAGVPVTWDETRVLGARKGDFIVTARRNGSEWYLAAMNDWTPFTTEVDLSFLPAGSYTLEIFSDGINADRHGEDYRHLRQDVNAGDILQITLAPGGGWVAKITPAVK